MPEIRKIKPGDNAIIASIIRKAMMEFGADPQTTVLGDPSLDSMYENYQAERAVYYIASLGGQVVGGCGIRQLAGMEENICELQRMFLLAEARGRKIGKQLLELCIDKAIEFGYDKIYLETLNQMTAARALYRQYGFREIDHPLGATGHGGCDIWMEMDLRNRKKKR
jgi:putative acetyltransferase